MNLTDLDTFIRVAAHGSFTGAAEELGVPKSTVSRRVSRLEDELGLELLQRGPRSFSLTEHGRQLQARSAPALREIEDVERSLADADDEPTGTLLVTAPHDVGSSRFFTTLLVEFRRRCPGVTLQIELAERVVDLVAEGVDIALRAHLGPLPDSAGLMTRRVLAMTAGLYASPEYLASRGTPRTPRSLVKHDCVAHPAMGRDDRWKLRRVGTNTTESFQVSPTITVNDMSAGTRLLAEGGGIGFVPCFVAHPHVERGELERVLPHWESTSGNLSLVWPASRHLAPRVRAFIDHTTEHLASTSHA